MSKSTLDNYKSPLKKWAKYFQDSRDKWKARSHEKQKRIDFLETKLKDLSNSRDYWKQKAKTLKKSNLTKQPSVLSSSVTDGNPSAPTNVSLCLVLHESSSTLTVDSKAPVPTCLPAIVDQDYGRYELEIFPHANGSAVLIPNGLLPWEMAFGHSYSLLVQQLGIQMVLEAHNSLRGAMKSLEIMAQFVPLKVPTGR